MPWPVCVPTKKLGRLEGGGGAGLEGGGAASFLVVVAGGGGCSLVVGLGVGEGFWVVGGGGGASVVVLGATWALWVEGAALVVSGAGLWDEKRGLQRLPFWRLRRGRAGTSPAGAGTVMRPERARWCTPR